MPAHTYTGRLTDIGLAPLTGSRPVMRVRPEREATGPDGLVSAAPVQVALDAAGAFSMSLAASTELTPQVRYVIEVGRFEETFDGTRFVGLDVWTFFAKPGGGPITDQGERSPYAIYIPPWPAGTPRGFYFDTAPPNAWGVRI